MNSNTFKTVILLNSPLGPGMFAGVFGGNSDDDGPSPADTILLAVVAPIAAGVMRIARSRSREFGARPLGVRVAR